MLFLSVIKNEVLLTTKDNFSSMFIDHDVNYTYYKETTSLHVAVVAYKDLLCLCR